MDAPLVTIVITSHNYAAYLGEAIESALAQTYPRVEVIVVDDGSTDDSIDVVERYAARITAVCQENGGMRSATNAGFAASHGDLVHFLDADDLLEPWIVQRVVDAFVTTPGAAHVQFRLAVVDAAGRPTGDTRPPSSARMPTGDLRLHTVRYRDHVRAPTSGLVYSRKALERVMPMPDDGFHRSPDQYMALTTSLLGPIVSLDEIGGSYRIHGRNAYAAPGLNLERLRGNLMIAAAEHQHLLRVTRELGMAGYPQRFVDVRDKGLLSARIISRKLDPARHPFPEDTLLGLARKGTMLALTYPEFPVTWKLMQAGWYLAMLAAPRRVAWWLGERMLIPEARGGLAALLGFRRRRT